MESKTENFIIGSRIELTCDGKTIFGMSVKSRPQNHEEMVLLFKELITAMESPEVPDLELLGKFSPL